MYLQILLYEAMVSKTSLVISLGWEVENLIRILGADSATNLSNNAKLITSLVSGFSHL